MKLAVFLVGAFAMVVAAGKCSCPRCKDCPADLRRMLQGILSSRNEKQNLKRALKQKIRDKWTAEQAVDDIERQLQGVGFAKQAAADTSSQPQRPAQKRLMEALTAPLGDTLEGQYRRRDNAINAIVAYCFVEEGQTVRRPRITSSSASSARPPTTDFHADNPMDMAVMSVFVKTDKERRRRCFLCVGKALSLAPDDPEAQDLIHEIYTSGD